MAIFAHPIEDIHPGNEVVLPGQRHMVDLVLEVIPQETTIVLVFAYDTRIPVLRGDKVEVLG